jgi:hypothetical protein
MPLGTVAFARQDLKLSNKLRNGSFTEGFSGWQAGSNVTDYYVDNGVLTFVGAGGLGSTGNNWISYNNPQYVFTEGEVVYNACWARSNELEVKFQIGRGYAGSTFSLTSEFELCSHFGTATAGNNRFTLGAATSKEVQVTNCIAISLTEVFGAGNEPTKEEMDTLIRQIGWFEGTRTLRQTETTNWLRKLMISGDGAGFHNSIYRGKFLGNEVTSKQWDRIADGTFEDMYIGDYWTINGTTYLIAAFNYYLNSGDTNLTTNHVTLVPAGSMYDHRMNPTDTTAGGYAGSEMRTSGLDQARTKIYADFAGHVVNHRRYLSTAVSNGQASAGASFDSDVELMNEVMALGSVVNGKGTYGAFNIGIEKSQLPLFALRPDLLNIREVWWLRDVYSATHFVFVNHVGNTYVGNANYVYGVRPVFSISA